MIYTNLRLHDIMTSQAKVANPAATQGYQQSLQEIYDLQFL